MCTIPQIKEDQNFLSGLEIPEYNVKLYLTYIGGDKVKYEMFYKDKLLFEGNDYRPSPMYKGQDSIEAAVALLDFFVLQIGDVERDYFAKYTPEQIEWRESSDCEQMKSRTLDFGCDNDQLDGEDFHAEAVAWFQERFIN